MSMMEEEIDLRIYVEVLFRHWMWIAGLAIVAALVAFGVSSLLPPTYEATALVAVVPSRYAMAFEPRFATQMVGAQDLPYAGYLALATSHDVVEDLHARLEAGGGEVGSAAALQDMLEAQAGTDSSLIRLTVSSPDAEQAARVANLWAETFVAQAEHVYGIDDEEVRLLQDQLARAEEELEAAEGTLILFQAANREAIQEAQLASARQDLQDYLLERRAIERTVHNAQALAARLAAREGEAVASPEDSLAVVTLQVQALNTRVSRLVEFQIPSLAGEIDDGSHKDEGRSSDAPSASPLLLEISDAALFPAERPVSELLSSVDGMLEALEDREAEIDGRVMGLESQILSLQQQLQESRAARNRLVQARDVAQEAHLILARKAEELDLVLEGVEKTVQLASQAGVPRRPVGPRRLFNTAVAGALGLMVAIFGIFAWEWWQGGEEGQGEGERGGQGEGENGGSKEVGSRE